MTIDMVPSSFKLQWHITERCNFRCRHCYQESYDTPEMPYEKMIEVFDQYVALIKKWKIPRNRAFLTITGGEPFLHKDLFRFLGRVYKYSSILIWSILSNGSLIDCENIKILKLLNIGAYQVSLEGMEENNDKIRGVGNFKKALEAVKVLVNEGVYVVISLTLTRENVNDIIPLALLLAKNGVKDFLIRRLVPFGNGLQLKGVLLSPSELQAFHKKMEDFGHQFYRANYGIKISFCCESPFFTEQVRPESSSLLCQRGEYCAVTRGMIVTLLPNGDLLACRRLPIILGNVLEASLEQLFYSERARSLRDKNQLPLICQSCSKFDYCYGGARCITYAYYDNLDMPDPQCWYANK